MSRFSGKIGFETTAERFVDGQPTGVWGEQHITEKMYYGDIVRNSRRWESPNEIVESINISNRFSILADKFAKDNLGAMRYVRYAGSVWKITDVEIEYPRIIISVGGLYNGPTASASFNATNAGS